MSQSGTHCAVAIYQKPSIRHSYTAFKLHSNYDFVRALKPSQRFSERLTLGSGSDASFALGSHSLTPSLRRTTVLSSPIDSTMHLMQRHVDMRHQRNAQNGRGSDEMLLQQVISLLTLTSARQRC